MSMQPIRQELTQCDDDNKGKADKLGKWIFMAAMCCDQASVSESMVVVN